MIRHYHGHLSGVYSLALHPGLDVLMTGSRDSSCRVWDMRTKSQVFCLSGHASTVCSILAQNADPQVVTGSHDSTVKLWDLRTGRTTSTLTYHKKSVRAMAMHPTQFAFASASADNLKKFLLPKGDFLHNFLAQQRAIVNALALNPDGVMASGGDDGSLWRVACGGGQGLCWSDCDWSDCSDLFFFALFCVRSLQVLGLEERQLLPGWRDDGAAGVAGRGGCDLRGDV